MGYKDVSPQSVFLTLSADPVYIHMKHNLILLQCLHLTSFFFLVPIRASGDSTFTSPDLFSLAQILLFIYELLILKNNKKLVAVGFQSSIIAFSCQGRSGDR